MWFWNHSSSVPILILASIVTDAGGEERSVGSSNDEKIRNYWFSLMLC